MKCKNCGVEFSEGIFCPECGTRNEESERISKNRDTEETKHKLKTEGKKMDFNKKWRNRSNFENKKIPWYLNGFFIMVIFFLSYAFFFIPAIILWIIRMARYKNKRKVTIIVTVLFIAVPLVIGIVGSIKEKNIEINKDELADKDDPKGTQGILSTVTDEDIDYTWEDVYEDEKDKQEENVISYKEWHGIMDVNESYSKGKVGSYVSFPEDGIITYIYLYKQEVFFRMLDTNNGDKRIVDNYYYNKEKDTRYIIVDRLFDPVGLQFEIQKSDEGYQYLNLYDKDNNMVTLYDIHWMIENYPDI